MINQPIFILVFGFGSRHRNTTFKHSLEIAFFIYGGRRYWAFLMFYFISWLLAPLNGNSAQSIPYRMTPIAHTSILPSNLKLGSPAVFPTYVWKHSGAMQPKLPASKSSSVSRLIAPAIPKSIILIFFSSEFTRTMFSSFKSRWMRLFQWQYMIPLTICLKNILQVSSSSLPCFCTYFSNSPPSRYSIMMATSIFFKVRQLVTLTILSCFNDFNISASTNIESMSEIEVILMIFMAHFYPLCLWLARNTFPNPPSPNSLTISYQPQQL